MTAETPRIASLVALLLTAGCLLPDFAEEDAPAAAADVEAQLPPATPQAPPATFVHLGNDSWPSVARVLGEMAAYLEAQPPPENLPEWRSTEYAYWRAVPRVYLAGGWLTDAPSGARIAFTILTTSNLTRSEDEPRRVADEADATEAALLRALAEDDGTLCRAMAGAKLHEAHQAKERLAAEAPDTSDIHTPYMMDLADRAATLHVARILAHADCPRLDTDPRLVAWALDVVAQAKALPDHPDEPGHGDLPHDNPKHHFLGQVAAHEWAAAQGLDHAAQLLALEAAEYGVYLLHNATGDAAADAPSFDEIARLSARVSPTLPPDSLRAWEYASGTVTHDHALANSRHFDDPPFRWKAYVALAIASGAPQDVLGERDATRV